MSPPEDGYRTPSLTTVYPRSAATAPERRNESQTADPATVAASPRSAKIPAPTIAPIPRKIAPRTVTRTKGRRTRTDLRGLTDEVRQDGCVLRLLCRS